MSFVPSSELHLNSSRSRLIVRESECKATFTDLDISPYYFVASRALENQGYGRHLFKLQLKIIALVNTTANLKVWPVVPMIALNKHPVFPKFIKLVEVTDPALMNTLRQKVRLNNPYAGVFIKKDDDNLNEVVTDVNDVYPVGSFVQVRLPLPLL